MSPRVPFARAAALFAGLFVLVFGAADARAAGPSFSQQAAFTGNADAFLGYSVAVDGNTAVVGAMNDNGNKGAAYVYTRSGSTWTQQQQLVAPDGAVGDQFGYTVALSGTTAMVAAVGHGNGAGAIYVFVNSGGFWSENSLISGTDTAACFGCGLALQGTTAVIGAPANSSVTGTAFVYVNSAGWHQQAALTGQLSGEAFGQSVGVSPDGTTAVVGAYNANTAAGRAYVFVSNAGTWSTQAVLTASDGAANDRFGYSVAAGNGVALVGAYQHGGLTGEAYVFTRSGTAWTQQAQLSAADGGQGDYFGYSVALSGSTAVIGAFEKPGVVGPGAVYVFSNSSGPWTQQGKLLPPGAGQYFGYSVAVSGTTFFAGAFGAVADSGAAYAFVASSTPVPAMGGWALVAMAIALGAIGMASRGVRAGGRS